MTAKKLPQRTASDRGVMQLVAGVQAPMMALSYDYEQIDEAHRDTVRSAAMEIKRGLMRTQEELITIGNRLIEVKEVLPHGQFEDWLNAEFDLSDRMAQNLMNVARVYGGKSETVSLFSQSALYLLAAPQATEAAREAAVVEAQASGQSPTKKRTQEIIDAHKPPPPSPAALATPALPVPPPLTLDQTMAWVWEEIKLHCGTEPATRLAWLRDHRDKLQHLPGAKRLLPANLHAAADRIEKELQGVIDHASRTEEKKQAQSPFVRHTIYQDGRMTEMKLSDAERRLQAQTTLDVFRQSLSAVTVFDHATHRSQHASRLRRELIEAIEALESLLRSLA